MSNTRAPRFVCPSAIGLVRSPEFCLIMIQTLIRMKISRNLMRPMGLGVSLSFSVIVAGFAMLQNVMADDAAKPAGSGDMVPLMLKLPAPAFKGTPKDVQLSSFVEPLSDKPRAPMMVPAGLKNIAPGSKITCSDKN